MLRLLLFVAMLQLLVQATCPDGFEPLRGGQCMGLHMSILYFNDRVINTAIEECSQIDGIPAVIIHNNEEYAYWRRADNKYEYLLLGLVCNESSKEWKWTDDSAVDWKPADYHEALDKPCTTKCAWVQDNGLWVHYCNDARYSYNIYCTTPKVHHSVPENDGCYGFEDDSDDGVCYQVLATAQNWGEAQLSCRKMGANLASIHNPKENAFVQRLALSKGADDGIYLGGAMLDNGSEFGWVDGTKSDYANFYPEFPMNNAGDCVALDTSSCSGEWMNIECSAKLPVACVRDKKIVELPEPKCVTGPYQEDALITSPGFPYNASMPCNFFLTVDEGKKIEAEIMLLEANLCCDHLVLYDAFLGGNVIANLTGSIHNATFTSPTSAMKVSWKPKGGADVKGLAMAFRGVQKTCF